MPGMFFEAFTEWHANASVNAGHCGAAPAGRPMCGRRRDDELLDHMEEAQSEQLSMRRHVQRPEHLTELSMRRHVQQPEQSRKLSG